MKKVCKECGGRLLTPSWMYCDDKDCEARRLRRKQQIQNAKRRKK